MNFSRNQPSANTIKRRKNNYFIYKVERIKISKLLISLVIICIIVSGMYFGGRIVVRKLANSNNGVCQNIINSLTVGIHSDIDISFTNIKTQAYKFASTSTTFYLLSYIYILFTIFKLDVLYYQPILAILLIVICIVNTTNIYYNREERIKMIEA